MKEKLEGKKNYQKPGYLNIAATIAFLIAAFGSIWFVMENALPQGELSLKNEKPILDQDTNQIDLIPSKALAENVTQETAEGESEPEPTSTAEVVEGVDSGDSGLLAEAETPPLETPLDVSLDVEDSGAGQLAFNDQAADETVSEAAVTEEENATLPEPKADLEQSIALVVSDSPTAREAASKSVAAPSQNRSAIAPPSEPALTGTVYYQEDGEPLPGVVVSSENRNTTTGLGGKFELSNVSSGDELDFSLPGLRSKKVAVEESKEINVVLSPVSLSNQKADIIGYSDQVNKSPEPVEGQNAFIQYVNTSLQYPDAARSQQIEGIVLLKVTISSTGSINNVEVKKSLSQSCDQEAIRLIREGPQWSPATYNGEPVEGSVRVRIVFAPN
ncbi:MAG: TonB family protein [Bacteroidota bacterium]